jgi:hypothetical protein
MLVSVSLIALARDPLPLFDAHGRWRLLTPWMTDRSYALVIPP